MATAPAHPIKRRYLAEDLIRLRRADEQERYVASQRRGRIDPNPHQIDAVIFALRRIPEGGCILGDEVGLGKTIEAGLVIAQLMAEGAERILVIVPKSLLGQWRDELYTLFSIRTREGGGDPETFAGPGVFLVGRELAGSARVAKLIRQSEPFDLCVIDEAHEIFAGIYNRYDRHGNYRNEAKIATTAHRVRSFLAATPVLLLTATPIQNSLSELWGLVQYVEPTRTLLGRLPTFRQLFIDRDNRKLVPGQAHDLRRRIATICQRTLRRQAQDFLERPFVDRRAVLFEYAMSPEEKALYDDVTAYLLEPHLCAFKGRQRRLLLLGFHRRMASSLRALAASLRNVADRLRAELGDDEEAVRQTVLAFVDDEEEEYEEDRDDDTVDVPEHEDPGARLVRRELERVEEFIRRAESLPGDSKARALIEAVRLIGERGARGEGSGKVVIFTESLTTQDYLEDLLLADGLEPEEITLFRGHNESPRAFEALARWEDEVGKTIPSYNQPSRSIAIRLALVHEFKTRSRVFISTEAGAKGLNLQFCDSLINYDLPWNPQRIEQRIGRCHRYSQQRDVTVINFLSRDNEAHRLTFEILSQKLDLFGKVLDVSDHVLYEPKTEAPEPLISALGVDFESALRRIYQRARTIEDIEEDLRELRESMDARRQEFEERMRQTAELIETRFDEKVRQVFRRIQQDLPAGLARLDRDLDRLVTGYLDAVGVAFERREEEGRVYLIIPPSPRLPESMRQGGRVALGHARDLEDVESLHLSHPLVRTAIAEAREASRKPFCVRFDLAGGDVPESLVAHRGRRGRLVVTKITYRGFEPVDRLRTTALLEGADAPLPEEEARALLELAPEDIAPPDPPLEVDDDELDDAVEEKLFVDQAEVSEGEQLRFERMIEQIERFVDDQMLVLRRRRQEVDERVEKARQRRDVALGGEARTQAEEELAKLESELNELDREIGRLAARQDPDYEKCRDRAHQRRNVKPAAERILDVEFILG